MYLLWLIPAVFAQMENTPVPEVFEFYHKGRKRYDKPRLKIAGARFQKPGAHIYHWNSYPDSEEEKLMMF